MNIEQLTYVMACPVLRATTYLPLLNDAMVEFGISSAQALFLGSIGHESGGLRYMEEIWGPTVDQQNYEPPHEKAIRLGNTHPGDGKKYRGRAPIQITGFDNYVEVSNALGYNYVVDPDQLAQPKDACRASAWWYVKHGCQSAATSAGNIVERYLTVNRIINLGSAHSKATPNGWDSRVAYLQRAMMVFPDFGNVEAGVASTAPVA